MSKIDEVLAKAKNKVNDVKVATNDYKPLPSPWSDYEVNSANILRSRKTGKIQQIPTGKKKYFIYNDNSERRSLSPDEINTMVNFKKLVNKITFKNENINVDALLNKPKIKKIISEGGKKHLLCFKLHQEGLNVHEIMGIVGSPYNATKRNIWYYTSGQKNIN